MSLETMGLVTNVENNSELDIAGEVVLDVYGRQVTSKWSHPDLLTSNNTNRLNSQVTAQVIKTSKQPRRNHVMLGNLSFREIAGKRKRMYKSVDNNSKHLESRDTPKRMHSPKKDVLKIEDGSSKKFKTIDPQKLIGKTLVVKARTNPAQNISIKFVSCGSSNNLNQNQKYATFNAVKLNSGVLVAESSTHNTLNSFPLNTKLVDCFLNSCKSKEVSEPKGLKPESTVETPNLKNSRTSPRHGKPLLETIRQKGNEIDNNKKEPSPSFSSKNNVFDNTKDTVKTITNPSYVNLSHVGTSNVTYAYNNKLSILSKVASEQLAIDGCFTERSDASDTVYTTENHMKNYTMVNEPIRSTRDQEPDQTSYFAKSCYINNEKDMKAVMKSSTLNKKQSPDKTPQIFAWCTQYITDMPRSGKYNPRSENLKNKTSHMENRSYRSKIETIPCNKPGLSNMPSETSIDKSSGYVTRENLSNTNCENISRSAEGTCEKDDTSCTQFQPQIKKKYSNKDSSENEIFILKEVYVSTPKNLSSSSKKIVRTLKMEDNSKQICCKRTSYEITAKNILPLSKCKLRNIKDIQTNQRVPKHPIPVISKLKKGCTQRSLLGKRHILPRTSKMGDKIYTSKKNKIKKTHVLQNENNVVMDNKPTLKIQAKQVKNKENTVPDELSVMSDSKIDCQNKQNLNKSPITEPLNSVPETPSCVLKYKFRNDRARIEKVKNIKNAELTIEEGSLQPDPIDGTCRTAVPQYMKPCYILLDKFDCSKKTSTIMKKGAFSCNQSKDLNKNENNTAKCNHINTEGINSNYPRTIKEHQTSEPLSNKTIYDKAGKSFDTIESIPEDSYVASNKNSPTYKSLKKEFKLAKQINLSHSIFQLKRPRLVNATHRNKSLHIKSSKIQKRSLGKSSPSITRNSRNMKDEGSLTRRLTRSSQSFNDLLVSKKKIRAKPSSISTEDSRETRSTAIKFNKSPKSAALNKKLSKRVARAQKLKKTKKKFSSSSSKAVSPKIAHNRFVTAVKKSLKKPKSIKIGMEEDKANVCYFETDRRKLDNFEIKRTQVDNIAETNNIQMDMSKSGLIKIKKTRSKCSHEVENNSILQIGKSQSDIDETNEIHVGQSKSGPNKINKITVGKQKSGSTKVNKVQAKSNQQVEANSTLQVYSSKIDVDEANKIQVDQSNTGPIQTKKIKAGKQNSGFGKTNKSTQEVNKTYQVNKPKIGPNKYKKRIKMVKWKSGLFTTNKRLSNSGEEFEVIRTQVDLSKSLDETNVIQDDQSKSGPNKAKKMKLGRQKSDLIEANRSIQMDLSKSDLDETNVIQDDQSKSGPNKAKKMKLGRQKSNLIEANRSIQMDLSKSDLDETNEIRVDQTKSNPRIKLGKIQLKSVQEVDANRTLEMDLLNSYVESNEIQVHQSKSGSNRAKKIKLGRRKSGLFEPNKMQSKSVQEVEANRTLQGDTFKSASNKTNEIQDDQSKISLIEANRTLQVELSKSDLDETNEIQNGQSNIGLNKAKMVKLGTKKVGLVETNKIQSKSVQEVEANTTLKVDSSKSDLDSTNENQNELNSGPNKAKKVKLRRQRSDLIDANRTLQVGSSKSDLDSTNEMQNDQSENGSNKAKKVKLGRQRSGLIDDNRILQVALSKSDLDETNEIQNDQSNSGPNKTKQIKLGTQKIGLVKTNKIQSKSVQEVEANRTLKVDSLKSDLDSTNEMQNDQSESGAKKVKLGRQKIGLIKTKKIHSKSVHEVEGNRTLQVGSSTSDLDSTNEMQNDQSESGSSSNKVKLGRQRSCLIDDNGTLQVDLSKSDFNDTNEIQNDRSKSGPNKTKPIKLGRQKICLIEPNKIQSKSVQEVSAIRTLQVDLSKSDINEIKNGKTESGPNKVKKVKLDRHKSCLVETNKIRSKSVKKVEANGTLQVDKLKTDPNKTNEIQVDQSKGVPIKAKRITEGKQNFGLIESNKTYTKSGQVEDNRIIQVDKSKSDLDEAMNQVDESKCDSVEIENLQGVKIRSGLKYWSKSNTTSTEINASNNRKHTTSPGTIFSKEVNVVNLNTDAKIENNTNMPGEELFLEIVPEIPAVTTQTKKLEDTKKETYDSNYLPEEGLVELSSDNNHSSTTISALIETNKNNTTSGSEEVTRNCEKHTGNSSVKHDTSDNVKKDSSGNANSSPGDKKLLKLMNYLKSIQRSNEVTIKKVT